MSIGVSLGSRPLVPAGLLSGVVPSVRTSDSSCEMSSVRGSSPSPAEGKVRPCFPRSPRGRGASGAFTL